MEKEKIESLINDAEKSASKSVSTNNIDSIQAHAQRSIAYSLIAIAGMLSNEGE